MKTNNCSRRIKECMALSILLLGLQPAVSAGEGVGDSVFSIGPRATYSTPKDADKGLWDPGVQARLHLSPALGLEASIDYRKNDFGPLTTVKTYPVQASLLAYLMPGGVVSPFLLGGVGWYHTQVEGPFDYNKITSRFGLHAGAGLEIMLGKSISLDGAYRYVWLEDVASKDLNALHKTYKDSGSMITIALNLLF
ncbi:MAG: outer membrane beta-barrel protein [Elusimicrobia bacterium]|nr:outer membrane beta-barrel protein [Elusimicrobiota bacterium]